MARYEKYDLEPEESLLQNKFKAFTKEKLDVFSEKLNGIKQRFIYMTKQLNIILESNLRISTKESYLRLGKFMLRYMSNGSIDTKS